MKYKMRKLAARRALLKSGSALASARWPGLFRPARDASTQGSTQGSARGKEQPGADAPNADPGMNLPRRADMTTIGDVGRAFNGFDPSEMLSDWDTGTLGRDGNGQTIRTNEVTAEDRDIEIAPGVFFPTWTFNGRVQGPTLRATEGDRLRIEFRNNGAHGHSLHFHGIQGAGMDGPAGSGLIGPGEEFIYEFDARPFGCHLYRRHAFPLRVYAQGHVRRPYRRPGSRASPRAGAGGRLADRETDRRTGDSGRRWHRAEAVRRGFRADDRGAGAGRQSLLGFRAPPGPLARLSVARLRIPFAVGSGAILQVLFKVGALVARNRAPWARGIDRCLVSGAVCGVLVMYLTGLLIKV